ncbi:putative acetyltransferase [Arabidopsis thaliana]|jgi:phospholipase/lecithinase/hemolysin|uniref:GDSL esterase/lipase At4g01130 n=2 Tax=Arabidopsis thaliana TaxID=3702 RepID=GDL61_ARATH|nr:GDSL-like Lipase/Acylhydrolase superfamily protein [Arabidopsis thaliana]Q9M153.1 RecName: Full=GDSL esterase/lipase At4g01130; AltName: Full=Extracellular lipase At4g01130; Flags: Precursor [Arabidopsis thaliana]ABL66800.1 At4g01130 [Arabidopsis thaliana]AEE81985.1 GDSL-like Lipase/Acylhydrolase superfamily protein [Arabidopsis thaliana]CAB80922.1 putative acetyltransferase [Arabidopsis thaliana]|eukprot:NP_192022.1 GDSL-like Lipase/Acylhydrolase superfamily protein [Arabidopsis thaliana]
MASDINRRRSFSLLVLIIVMLYGHKGDSKCDFEAIFNFGDSNSDTGGFWAAFPAQSGPWGMTYFKKPAGRASDGRLIIDFLAKSLGMPFLSPYLQSIGSDFRHGANFATLASTVLLPNTSLFVSGISPFSLAIQLNQMKQFKVNVDESHSLDRPGLKILPSKIVFGKSLYTFYIGQNDFTSNLASIGVERVKLYLPQVIGQIAGTIKEIYGIGGRTFLVLNLAPVGCYPAILTGYTHTDADLDKYGCLIPVNKAVKYYNTLLNKTLSQTRTELKNATVIYLDTHKILLDLFQHPKSYGMKHGIKACCGYGGRPYNFNQKLFCGNTKVIGNFSTTAKACHDPHNYVSWDGIHATEAANHHISMAILDGSISYPPFILNNLCSP